MFKEMHLGSLKLSNRFVFPPIKLAYGNPAVGRPELTPSPKPMKVLVAGGGPAGMSAAYYLSCRGLSEYPGNPGAGKCIQNDIH
jgi:hypothetical protein